ncbi:MAG: family 43 glycosylhydrolase [Oscillospiraceae bacterium]|jgi:beta-xylosidase|nr:family 43 glycosylhydrolase [Oscillospiraceae bacterium]
MKRLLCVLLACILLLGLLPLTAAADDALFTDPRVNFNSTRPRESCLLRDPCVVVYQGTYFIYGTGAAWPGYGCYVSRDMENFAGPVRVWTPPAGHESDTDYWAPECHYYNGNFYIFATYHSRVTGHRGVSIFRADNPLGPFEEITAQQTLPETGEVTRQISPLGWDAIDGTLYVDPQGQPWLVFVHEWTSMPDGIGDFSAAKLSSDLSTLLTEPVSLFRANTLAGRPFNGVTDGCWLYRSKTGELLMLWSGSGGTYCIGVARSESGDILGPWVQNPRLLYAQNSSFPLEGGHGSLFYDLDGQLSVSLHAPNASNAATGVVEHTVYFAVEDLGDTLRIVGAPDDYHGSDIFANPVSAAWLEAGLHATTAFQRFWYEVIYYILWLPSRLWMLFGF